MDRMWGTGKLVKFEKVRGQKAESALKDMAYKSERKGD